VHSTGEVEIQKGDEKEMQQKNPVAVRQQRWEPPGEERLKINVDGAFNLETSIGACGFIIRNCRGEPVMAGASKLRYVRDAMMAETLACKFALEAAEVHGISRIEVETDSALLREALITSSRDLAPEGALFIGIREFLADQFICNSIQNVPHSCNSIAHEIAKMGMSWDPGQSVVWTDPLPEFVNTLVARDLAEHLVISIGP
jgi:hypothetical protein